MNDAVDMVGRVLLCGVIQGLCRGFGAGWGFCRAAQPGVGGLLEGPEPLDKYLVRGISQKWYR